jgi:hypothetical protein
MCTYTNTKKFQKFGGIHQDASKYLPVQPGKPGATQVLDSGEFHTCITTVLVHKHRMADLMMTDILVL